jgi:MFS family permease
VSIATEDVEVMEGAAAAPAAAGASTLKTSTPHRHFWFGVIFLIYAIDWADRSLIGAILPSMKTEFGLTDAKTGLISGFLFIGLGLLAVPAGVLVDRFSRKYMIAIMTAVWSLATWSMGLASSFAGLAAARLAVGAGEAGYNPAGYALISAWYPRRIRGTMVGIFNIAQPLGGGLGAAMAGWITYRYGWRSVFGTLAIPGLVLAALMLLAPDYRTVTLDRNKPHAPRAGPLKTLWFILTTRTLLLVFLAQLPIVFYIYAATTWSTTFFMRTFGLNVGYAASITTVATLFVSVGPAACGWFSDRLTRENPAGRITASLILLVIAIAFHSLVYLGPMMGLSLVETIAAASLGQFCIAGHWGTLVAAGLDLVPLPRRGSCQSFFPLFQSLTAMWAGGATGFLSDRCGLAAALEMTLLFGFSLGFLILWFARKGYLADYEKQKSLGTFPAETTF